MPTTLSQRSSYIGAAAARWTLQQFACAYMLDCLAVNVLAQYPMMPRYSASCVTLDIMLASPVLLPTQSSTRD
jgi:hypothetical protein